MLTSAKPGHMKLPLFGCFFVILHLYLPIYPSVWGVVSNPDDRFTNNLGHFTDKTSKNLCLGTPPLGDEGWARKMMDSGSGTSMFDDLGSTLGLLLGCLG